jgi:RNA polymerase sigma factor (TIGR02999 family)
MSENGEITHLLGLAYEGDKKAEARVFELLYNDLRRLAASYVGRERRGHTLQPTALLNEAYLRLVSTGWSDWKSRSQFLAAAAKVMRHVLVDWARARCSKKRGGRWVRIELDRAEVQISASPEQILDLDRALDLLAQQHQRCARVVELRYFGGMADDEIAKIIGVTDRTVTRDWQFGRAWLEGVLNKPVPEKSKAADDSHS